MTPFEILQHAASPNLAIVALSVTGLVLALFTGRFLAPARKVHVIKKVEVIPETLSRLAAVLKIKRDAPETQSYGRMIHDLFEERDLEISNLKAELGNAQATLVAPEEHVQHEGYIADLEAVIENLEKAQAGLRQSLRDNKERLRQEAHHHEGTRVRLDLTKADLAGARDRANRKDKQNKELAEVAMTAAKACDRAEAKNKKLLEEVEGLKQTATTVNQPDYVPEGHVVIETQTQTNVGGGCVVSLLTEPKTVTLGGWTTYTTAPEYHAFKTFGDIFDKGTAVFTPAIGQIYQINTTKVLTKAGLARLANMGERPTGQLGEGEGVWISPHTRKVFFVGQQGGETEIGVLPYHSQKTPGFYRGHANAWGGPRIPAGMKIEHRSGNVVNRIKA